MGGESGAIEIHFIDEVLPGYFWLFPVQGNRVNVGIGMLISEHRKLKKSRKKSLKKIQKWVIEEHPRFKPRFANSTLVSGSEKGWQLPFGSPRKNAEFQPRRVAMAGAMCVGDAASLVDPFSGEGIGNALLSAKMTSKHFDKTQHTDGFTDEAAKEYMADLWDALGSELKNSKTLQQVMKWKLLTNWFVKKASKKEEIGKMMSEMIASKESQKMLWSPWFLMKTLLLP